MFTSSFPLPFGLPLGPYLKPGPNWSSQPSSRMTPFWHPELRHICRSATSLVISCCRKRDRRFKLKMQTTLNAPNATSYRLSFSFRSFPHPTYQRVQTPYKMLRSASILSERPNPLYLLTGFSHAEGFGGLRESFCSDRPETVFLSGEIPKNVKSFPPCPHELYWNL